MLTYDVIEIVRPWADWVVVHLCINEVVEREMFEIENEAYWLAGESKQILIQHFTDFFDEVIEYKGSRYSRFTHIEKIAERLAKVMVTFENEKM